MPNWCEGYLKIRGKKKDLINFIENEFVIAKSESVISGIEYILPYNIMDRASVGYHCSTTSSRT